MNLKEAIQELADKNETIYSIPATVIAVNGHTCDVDPINGGATIFDCKITAGDGTTGILINPKIGSVVIVTMLSKNNAYVALYDEIDSIQFRDGSFGGLAKTQELKTQLDKTNEVVNALVNALTTFTPVSGDGGAALKTFATSALAGKSVGDYANIENTNIKHG